MRMRVKTAVLLIVMLLAAGTASAAAQEQGVDQASGGIAELNYLYVFGDSFASGQGVGYYVPSSNVPGGNQCHKSLYSFGFRLFVSLNPNGPNSVFPNRYFPACSGAKVDDIFATDQSGQGPQLAQVAPVPDGGTGVAIVAVGVNDLGFTPVLTECVLTTSCHTTSTLPQIVDAQQLLGQTAPKLFELYVRLKAYVVGSGHMTVFVVGYPQLFNESSTDIWCAGALGFEPAERAWANERARALNDTLLLVTSLLPDVHFVDVDPVFEGHRLCDPKPWIHGITLPIVHSFHPNGTGHLVTEAAILAAMRNLSAI